MSRKAKAAEFLEEAYDIQVTGRHLAVTQPMKDYAIQKISKIERFSHRIVDVVVTMDIQKLDHRVDIIAKIDNVRLKSSGSSTDMYASIDIAVDRLTEQLRRYKSRVVDHHPHININENVYRPSNEEGLLELNDEIEAENNRRLAESFTLHPIVKKEVRPLRTLTTSEAILKMELNGDHFMLFRCEEDRKLKVIYRREDGNFGIIEPE